jgi:hypothetical protein
VARAREAARIVQQRLTRAEFPVTEARYDLIGVDAVHRGTGTDPTTAVEPAEVRLRVAARTETLLQARRLGREAASLWLNGPCGGAGVTRETRENIAITSVLLPRELVMPATGVQLNTAGATP